MTDFYKTLSSYIEDEKNDNGKYLLLAEQAPTEKARKILTDIAREEEIHKKFLMEIMSDMDSVNSK